MDIAQLYQRFLESDGVSTDTRSIQSNQLFFALSGPSFNGNKFAVQAIDKGASLAIIDDPAYEIPEKTVLVEDSLKALQDLANHHRRQFDIPVLGITGSNGKTTTKELLTEVIRKKYKTHSTEGNLNNHIGVPLTLLSMPLNIEFAIIEMGANRQGDIHSYCLIAEPNLGLITNIGKAHLEGFGGLKGVEKGKTELFRFIEKYEGAVFYRKEDPILPKHVENLKSWSYGESSKCDFEYQASEGESFMAFSAIRNGSKTEIISNLTGKYNFYNAMAAAAIGEQYGISIEIIKEAIENYFPDNNRSEVVQQDNYQIILDAYNANPTSMDLALENLASINAERRIAILGEMNEIGDDSNQEHRAVIELAMKLGIDQLVLVGAQFKDLAVENGIAYFDKVESAREYFNSIDKDGSVILVKGSRSNQLEKLLS